MTIGEKLRALREKRSLTLDDVARDLELTRQAIYNYESDTRIPRDEIKIKICQYYGVSVENIFFDQKSNEKLLRL